MPRKPKVLPTFASEEEEIRFWDEHSPADYIEGPADIIIRLKREKKRQVTVPLVREKEPILRPGDRAPEYGLYAVVGPRGGRTGEEVTSAKGKPLPPTPKAGQGYVLAEAARHKR